jgi:hypothetical protein
LKSSTYFSLGYVSSHWLADITIGNEKAAMIFRAVACRLRLQAVVKLLRCLPLSFNILLALLPLEVMLKVVFGENRLQASSIEDIY